MVDSYEDTEEEKPRRHFRGVWARPEVFELVRNGNISAKAAWLLLVIDSLVNLKKKDCFASNQYLAEEIGVKEQVVKHLIGQLVEAGLVIRTGFNGRQRHMRTTWSRLPEGSELTWQPGQKRPGRGVGKDPHIIASRYITTKRENRVSIRVRKKDDRSEEFANRLNEVVSSVRKVNATSKPHLWARSFQHLIRTGISQERIDAVLKWYENLLRRVGDLIRVPPPCYYPIAYSGPLWIKKWDSLEIAMHRDQTRTKFQPGGPPLPKRKPIWDESLYGPKPKGSTSHYYEA